MFSSIIKLHSPLHWDWICTDFQNCSIPLLPTILEKNFSVSVTAPYALLVYTLTWSMVCNDEKFMFCVISWNINIWNIYPNHLFPSITTKFLLLFSLKMRTHLSHYASQLWSYVQIYFLYKVMTGWSKLMSCFLLHCILTEIQVGYTPVQVKKF